MKASFNFLLDPLDVTDVFNPKTVWIEIFKPDKSFYIEGNLMEGYIRNNMVLECDKLCIRYNWNFKDYIDVEVYSHGRNAWFRLNEKQFNKIKYMIKEIH